MNEFHDAVDRGDFGRVKLLLSSDKNLVNRASEQGIYPLQQACFRSHVDIAEYLLENGADVNTRDRSEGYTALMFAAIAGNLELTKILLQHGARSNDTNKLGRNAAQMASFVGNHFVTTVINNFVEKEEVTRYTSQSTVAKLKLPANAANALYRLIMAINFTPVKIFMVLDSTGSCLLDHWQPASNVLEDLLEKYFTPHRTHEAVALKFHLLGCCLRKAGEHIAKQINKGPDSSFKATKEQSARLLVLMKQFLQGADPHGLPFGQETFLRQALSTFPHRESVLWHMVVRRVSEVQPGFSPTALSVLKSAINGQGGIVMPTGDSVSQVCSTCDDANEKTVQIKLCRNCKEVGYCSVTCQRLHWFTHKKYCPILKAHHDHCRCSQEAARLASTKQSL